MSWAKKKSKIQINGIVNHLSDQKKAQTHNWKNMMNNSMIKKNKFSNTNKRILIKLIQRNIENSLFIQKKIIMNHHRIVQFPKITYSINRLSKINNICLKMNIKMRITKTILKKKSTKPQMKISLSRKINTRIKKVKREKNQPQFRIPYSTNHIIINPQR